MRIGLDIESDLSHKTIWLVKTIDLDSGEVRTWKEANSLGEYLKGVSLIAAHNGIGFDFKVLMRRWGMKIPLSQMFDTLILSRLLKPNRESGHSLESWGQELGRMKTEYQKIWFWMKGISSKEFEEAKGKIPGPFDDPIMPLLEYYCEGDVLVLKDLFWHLQGLKEQWGFSDESVELEHEVAYIISEQEDNGFKLDIPYATCLLTDVKTRMAEIEEQMQERWPPYIVERYSEKRPGKRLKDAVVTFNPGSRQQVAEKLIELGWKPEKFTPTGRPIVDEVTLGEVKGIPEAKLIADYFLLQKRQGQIESWIEAVGDDGRVHGRVLTNGTVTGRMSHSGPNMAQIPRIQKGKKDGVVVVLEGWEGGYGAECRQCWQVEPGNVLVGCDASGLELRMLAHYMGDSSYTEAVAFGDVHTVNQQAAGIATRDDAKTFIYAFLYGAGDSKIGSIVGGGAKEGKKLKEKFLKGLPALGKLKDRLEKSCKRGYCKGLDGRNIWIESDHSSLNYLLQGAGAVVMKKALVLFYRKIQEHGWPVKLVVNVHDEMQWETSPEFADITGRACVQSIVEAGEYFKMNCPLSGEYKYGRSWRDTH